MPFKKAKNNLKNETICPTRSVKPLSVQPFQAQLRSVEPFGYCLTPTPPIQVDVSHLGQSVFVFHRQAAAVKQHFSHKMRTRYFRRRHKRITLRLHRLMETSFSASVPLLSWDVLNRCLWSASYRAFLSMIGDRSSLFRFRHATL